MASMILRVARNPRGPMCLFVDSVDGTPVSYWKVIMSVRLSVGAFGFKGWFVMLPLR
jgi:hypothetical protein